GRADVGGVGVRGVGELQLGVGLAAVDLRVLDPDRRAVGLDLLRGGAGALGVADVYRGDGAGDVVRAPGVVLHDDCQLPVDRQLPGEQVVGSLGAVDGVDDLHGALDVLLALHDEPHRAAAELHGALPPGDDLVGLIDERGLGAVDRVGLHGRLGVVLELAGAGELQPHLAQPRAGELVAGDVAVPVGEAVGGRLLAARAQHRRGGRVGRDRAGDGDVAEQTDVHVADGVGVDVAGELELRVQRAGCAAVGLDRGAAPA